MLLVLPELAPLTLELHAWSRPPPPTTAAPAPIARSRLRRLTPPSGPMLPESTVWSLITHRSPCEVVLQRGDRTAATEPGQSLHQGAPGDMQVLGGHPFASDIPLPSPRRQRPS